MHVTAMMFCKIPSQEQLFLAFYAYTWCLLSFCGCVQSNFALNSNQIILMETLFQLFLTHLHFGPRTSFWFRHTCVLVFRKMSFLIHFIFTFLAGTIFRPLFTTFCYLFYYHLFSYSLMSNLSQLFFGTTGRTHCRYNIQTTFHYIFHHLPHSMHVIALDVAKLNSNFNFNYNLSWD